MTNTELLEAKIKASGLKKNYIAEQLGITYQGFYMKLIGKNEFIGSEIQKLTNLLNISDKEIKPIFFNQQVDNSSTKKGECLCYQWNIQKQEERGMLST